MDEHIEAALTEAGARINALVANERRLIDKLATARKDAERLAWLLREECVPEGFVHVPTDRYEYAMQVAIEAGREEPTDADCLDGFRRLVDAAMATQMADCDA